MTFLPTILKFLSINDRSEIMNQKFKKLPSKLQIEILKEATLKSLKGDLTSVEKNKAKQTEDIDYLEFANSMMKDSGVKAKIIRRYLLS